VTHTLSLYGSSGELHRALFDRTLTVSPPNSPPSLPANRRQCPRSTAASYFWAARASRGGSAAVVVAQHRIARRRAAEERATRFSSASDDKVGGFPAPIRSARQRGNQKRKERLCSLLLRAATRDFRRSHPGSRRSGLPVTVLALRGDQLRLGCGPPAPRGPTEFRRASSDTRPRMSTSTMKESSQPCRPL
jgi:hypothetical protein